MKQLQKAFLLSLIVITTLTGITNAQTPGTIDSSFASNGVLILQPNMVNVDVANALAVLPNNKILLAGITDPGNYLWDACVYRILADGTVDATFGVNGISIFDVGGDQDYLQAMKVLSNGKIIVAGGAFLGGADVDFFAARLTEDGFLDPTFGNNGITIIPIQSEEGEDVAEGIAIQPDGKIILVGATAIPNTTDVHTCLVRLNENGSIDNSFGTNGIVVSYSGNPNDHSFDALLLEDGSIMTTGYADVLNQMVLIDKFTSSGAPYPGFGNNGIAIFDLNTGNDVGWAIRQHPNGKILVAGRKGNGIGKSDFMVISIAANGTLDTGFGINGIATKNVKTQDAALDMLFEPTGKIVLAGSSGGGLLGSNDFAICRFNEDGSVDPAFGTNGATVSEITSFFSEATCIGMQSDGKLMVGGKAAEINNDFGLVRYFSDPIISTCTTPANPVTTAITANSALLSWDNSSNVDSFQVKYRSINNQDWIKMYVYTNSVMLTGLTPATKYAWKVKAKCEDGVSDFAGGVKFKTLPQRLADGAIEMNSAIQLFPNPSTGNFQLSFNTGENISAKASIQIINIFGQVVDSRIISIADGMLNETFNLSGQLVSGTYFLKIVVNDKIYNSRMVLQP